MLTSCTASCRGTDLRAGRSKVRRLVPRDLGHGSGELESARATLGVVRCGHRCPRAGSHGLFEHRGDLGLRVGGEEVHGHHVRVVPAGWRARRDTSGSRMGRPTWRRRACGDALEGREPRKGSPASVGSAGTNHFLGGEGSGAVCSAS